MGIGRSSSGKAAIPLNALKKFARSAICLSGNPRSLSICMSDSKLASSEGPLHPQQPRRFRGQIALQPARVIGPKHIIPRSNTHALCRCLHSTHTGYWGN